MPQALQFVPSDSLITGWDFSTGACKCLAFNVDGNTVASVSMPTDLWTENGVSELSLLQLEGQAYASVRGIAARLNEIGRLPNWIAGGISATHHTSGRIDADQLQVRRAICWNDQTLAQYHAEGLHRLGGQEKVRQLIGGPWAERYTLSHLIKDEKTLSPKDWRRTARIGQHGVLAAGYLTGNFDVISVSAAASTGIMDLRTCQWRREMLAALENAEFRDLAWSQLPKIIDPFTRIGPLRDSLAKELGLDAAKAPIVFPTSDDQQAGLIGGGAVDAGQMAIILGNSAVVNSSATEPPATDNLDAMKLNWGPYLWMRCYTNGAQFLDRVVGADPDWNSLEMAGQNCPPGCDGFSVLPFVFSEPSLGVAKPRVEWTPKEPQQVGARYRAALEALAYLIALGVRAHEQAGQKIERITVSGGIARSSLMCEILASVLNKPLHKLQSDEGPALGAAVTALAALETELRRTNGIDTPFTVADAVAQMVKFSGTIQPNEAWLGVYRDGLKQFETRF